MPAPLVIGAGLLIGGLAHKVAGSILHPIDVAIASGFAPQDYLQNQIAWYDQPYQMPSPEALTELWLRGMRPGYEVRWGLRHYGIDTRTHHTDPNQVHRQNLWLACSELKRAVPDPGTILDGFMRGIIGDADARRMMNRAGGSWDKLIETLEVHRSRPDAAAAFMAWREGRIGDSEAETRILEGGGSPESWFAARDWYQTTFSPQDWPELYRRGLADIPDLDRWLKRARMDEDGTLARWVELAKTLPGVSDLTLMGIREAFRPELGSLYDYYSEFPELTRPWFRKLGFDYPVGFEIPTQTGPRQATMADMAWAAHWHPMPLGMAFAAYQRFRPDRIADYQAEVPGLKPFGINDLRLHMRLADLPPGVRDWMIALSHQPLSRMDIRRSITYSRKDEQWAVDAYLDLGTRRVDAEVLAHNAVEQQRQKDVAWITALGQAGNRKLVSITESLYRDGIINRDQATRRLTEMGIPELTATQLLDLQELDLKHSLISGAITATRRAFFGGEILAGDVVAQLGRFGVLPFRGQLFLQTWQIQFTQKRKRLETGKIATMVVEGLMSAGDAKARLGNLGWSDPDATLLLAEAAGKVRKREAAEAKAGESQAQRRARDLERLAKQADAQAKKLRSEANRVAPRGVLMKWAREGEIGEDSFRSMMRERGYPEGDIDLYWQEVVRPKPRKPVPSPKGPQFPKPPGSKHPMEGQLQKWYLTETIDRGEYLDALKSIGWGDDDAERIVYNADLKHGKAGTTEEPPAPPPPG